MAWRDFAGQDQLQSGIQARNDGRLAYEARILENEHASFCLLGADQIACAHQEISRMLVRPKVRARRGVGMGRNQLRQGLPQRLRSEEHTSELQSLMRISYAVFCLKKKN